MQYTISSHGRPIGTTDLGFTHLGGPSRSGWFHPNADGERLMPVIASVLPAMRAYLHRDVLGEDGRPIVQPDLIGSTTFADVAEALHHVGALDLTLHAEDGSLVPTELVGIQDSEQLLALLEEEDGACDARECPFGDELEDTLDEALGKDFELDPDVDADAMVVDDVLDDVAWTPDDEQPAAFPRYQVHVVLAGPVTRH